MFRRCLPWLIAGLLFPEAAAFASTSLHEDELTWTFLIPENDTRPADVRHYDVANGKRGLAEMNANEKVFHHRLTWRALPMSQLLGGQAPFCELDFDMMHPLLLTDREKVVLREYLTRGGFLFLGQDAYPYSPQLYWQIRGYPVVDFILKELPAIDPGFTSQRIDETHPVFRQYHVTRINDAEREEIRNNPYCPDFTLVSYHGHPCAFIYGNYYAEDGHWAQLQRPFAEDLDIIEEDYYLNVNLYIYVTMH